MNTKELQINREIVMLPISSIETNDGQLKGLPKNPRSIKGIKFDKLKQSIQNYPEMLSWRSLLVYSLDNGKYIIVGGNMRYRAMKALGHKECPVFIIPKETPIEKIKAYTILDNNGFGEWDFDALANEWEALDLDNWGVDLPIAETEVDIDHFFNEIANQGELNNETDKVCIVVSAQFIDKIDEIRNIVKKALEINGFEKLEIK